MREHKLCVFIGRFQPVHQSHREVMLQGLELADRLLMIVGSSHSASNIKNPFSFEDRETMIRLSLTAEENKRLIVVPARDHFYSLNTWVAEIQNIVRKTHPNDAEVLLLGSFKDASSFYLNLFPQWEFKPAKFTKMLSATDVREKLFSPVSIENLGWADKGWNVEGTLNPSWRDDLHFSVAEWLEGNFLWTNEHLSCIREYQFIKQYKERWASAPFPPTFVTSDAVVIQSGHVLLVKRKFEPGKGLYALPGGFVRQDETLEAAAIRELREETGIKVPAAVLKKRVVESKTFDYPERSARGRTITTAFLVRLDETGGLPEIKGGDDAASAEWVPISSVGSLEAQFFDDHYHILNHFLVRG